MKKLIGEQPFKGQVWAGSSDLAATLADVVHWAVESSIVNHYSSAIAHCLHHGYITTRQHVCSVGTWESYALTDAGFDKLKDIGYGNMYDRAVKAHEFYKVTAQ